MKTVIISGANGGIGIEIAKTLMQKGYFAVLLYHKNKNEIKKLNGNFLAVKCDVTNEQDIENLVNSLKTQNINVTHLVNCAGVSKFNLIQDVTFKEMQHLINVNLVGTMLLTKHISKIMISNKKGNIINISSIWGVVGSSMESVYSATKGGINSFTLALAKELGPSNINVNAVCPGLIKTPMNESLSEDTINSIIEETPIKRMGEPIDVANLVNFLASDEASFITGQIITIDGGLTL
ncbi:MAG: SDR family oxidoreductase [Clostridiales bacterium]|nr:SDR family oxidoreductase [Clostridiales bacterium]